MNNPYIGVAGAVLFGTLLGGLIVGGLISYSLLQPDLDNEPLLVQPSDNRPTSVVMTPSSGNILSAPAPSDGQGAAQMHHPRSLQEVLANAPGFPTYYSLYQLAYLSSVKDLPDLIRQSRTLEDNLLRVGFVTVFLEKFSYLNPRQALAFIQAEIPNNEEDYLNFSRVIYREWTRQDQRAAVASLQEIGDTRLRNFLMLSIAREREILDTATYNTLFEQLPRESQQALQQAQLRSLEPRQALARALQETNQQNRRNSMYSAAARWVADSPLEAIVYIQSLSASSSIPASEVKQLFNYAVSIWARRDFDSAFEYAEITENNSDLVSTLLSQLTQSDPEKAVRIAQVYKNQYKNAGVLDSTLSSWAHNDVKAMKTFVDSNGIQLSRTAESSLAYAYANADPLDAMRWSMGRRDEVVRNVVTQFVQQNPQQAEQYLAGVESGSTKNYLIEILAYEKSKTDPLAALDWLNRESKLADPKSYEAAKAYVFSHWINRAPEQAADYLSRSSDAEKEQFIPQVISGWYDKDKQGTLNWINTMPAGRLKDRAWSSYVSRQAYSENDTNNIIANIDRIADTEIRQRTAMILVHRWIREEPQRADEMIQRYNLNRAALDATVRQYNR